MAGSPRITTVTLVEGGQLVTFFIPFVRPKNRYEEIPTVRCAYEHCAGKGNPAYPGYMPTRRHPMAKYCSASCRQMAYSERKNQEQ